MSPSRESSQNRVDPHVPLEHLDRVLGKLARHLPPREFEVLQQRAGPAAAVLDADQSHAGEPGQHPVADRRRERDHLERRVRDELGDPVADRELLAAADLGEPE
jgi:hypothetical protein